eukprot:CAMPEP_0183318164 /NCGR_PEP_ID=MMETSP0160_2-20130417/59915_1 /TAXON_ID=2839 ORGANISM="Odontella Sinensis, Strain Grunow 1884" /NCGR_SAMPLE_ID=MMETSP0160_2 /ASSEMBLY_ACC=CAM_ASM_000250 /LENGTH=396 /DNA_ID=CAMNT_0025484349 /DNA_START=36 /DNA_END=1226 /DNA_ORIENTATION=-
MPPSPHILPDSFGIPVIVCVSPRSEVSDEESDITTSVALDALSVEKYHPFLREAPSEGLDSPRQERTHRRNNTDPAGQKLGVDFEVGLNLGESISQVGSSREERGDARRKDGLHYGRVGTSHFRRGDFPAAMKAYRIALKLHKRDRSRAESDEAYADHSLAIATALGNMGAVYWKIGNFDATAIYLEEAIRIQEEVAGRFQGKTIGSTEAAQTLLNLGRVQTLRGKYVDAREALQRAKRIFEVTCGSFHVNIAQVKEAMGKVHFLLGDFDQALIFHVDALRINSAILHPQHPSVLSSMMNVANAYHRSGDLKAAELAYIELLEVQKAAMYRAIDPQYRRMVSAQVGKTMRLIRKVQREGDRRHVAVSGMGVLESRDTSPERRRPDLACGGMDDWGV